MKIFKFPLHAAIALAWAHDTLAKSCSDLRNYTGSGRTTIESSEVAHHSPSANAIAYCRVSGSVGYGERDNFVGFELWLPSQKSYNGRFMVVGNGGFAGIIDTSNMEKQLEQGFAVAGGDSGHRESNNGNGTTTSGQYIPFLNDKEQTKAWIHDSIAIITNTTRDITSFFYGRPPKHSYYNGCSTGGAQGFALAQYYPELFDGIYAGSPGNWYSHLMLSFLWNGKHTAYQCWSRSFLMARSRLMNTQGDAFLDQATLNTTTQRILEACDGVDGVVDGLIENPLKCHFDVDTLACSSTGVSGNNQTCLSPKQLQSLKAIYAGPKNSKTGEVIYPGFQFGSEREWMMQETALYVEYAAPLLQNLVFHNLSYDVETFNFDDDVTTFDNIAGPLIDEISPDLDAFRLHGGKIIVTQGWADPYNAPTWPIEHLKQLEGSNNRSGLVAEFFSLYMVPGGGHCGAAETYSSVPATSHINEALLAWVENDTFPSWIRSSDPPDGSARTRKLCPWPKTAKLRDHMMPDLAESYDCIEH